MPSHVSAITKNSRGIRNGDVRIYGVKTIISITLPMNTNDSFVTLRFTCDSSVRTTLHQAFCDLLDCASFSLYKKTTDRGKRSGTKVSYGDGKIEKRTEHLLIKEKLQNKYQSLNRILEPVTKIICCESISGFPTKNIVVGLCFLKIIDVI